MRTALCDELEIAVGGGDPLPLLIRQGVEAVQQIVEERPVERAAIQAADEPRGDVDRQRAGVAPPLLFGILPLLGQHPSTVLENSTQVNNPDHRGGRK